MKLALNSNVLNRYRQLANDDEKATQELVNKVLKEWLGLTPAQHKGKEAEETIRGFLYKHRNELNIRTISQYDVVLETLSGDFVMIEYKRQEYFKAPPFDGHGMPTWQFDKYMRQQKKCGMRVLLLIDDPDKNCYFKQWVDVLENRKIIDSNCIETNRNPRRIYNLNLFDEFEKEEGEEAFVEWMKETLETVQTQEKLKFIFGGNNDSFATGTDDEAPF